MIWLPFNMSMRSIEWSWCHSHSWWILWSTSVLAICVRVASARTKWYQPKESQGFSQHHQDGSRLFLAVVFLFKRICLKENQLPQRGGILWCTSLKVINLYPLSPPAKQWKMTVEMMIKALGEEENEENTFSKFNDLQISWNHIQIAPNYMFGTQIAHQLPLLSVYLYNTENSPMSWQIPNKSGAVTATKKLMSQTLWHYKPLIQDYWRKCEWNPMIWSCLIRVCH